MPFDPHRLGNYAVGGDRTTHGDGAVDALDAGNVPVQGALYDNVSLGDECDLAVLCGQGEPFGNVKRVGHLKPSVVMLPQPRNPCLSVHLFQGLHVCTHGEVARLPAPSTLRAV